MCGVLIRNGRCMLITEKPRMAYVDKWIYLSISWTKSDFQSVLGNLFPLICLQECPRIDLFTEIPSLERFTKNLEKGLECASLNNPVWGGMTLLKSRSRSVGISIDRRMRSRRKIHGHSRPLDWRKKQGHYIPCPFSSIFVNSEEIGIVDPQGPWEHLDCWFFHVQEVVGECATWDRSEPSELS